MNDTDSEVMTAPEAESGQEENSIEASPEGGGAQPESGIPDAGTAEKSVQSMEERARNAARRRKAELDEAVRKARQEGREEALREREQDPLNDPRVQSELAMIHSLDPRINGLEDILRQPSAESFKQYVRKGNSFIDAYYLANREALIRSAEAAAVQRDRNSRMSKSHLQSSAPRGSGAGAVPQAELALYRQLCPDAGLGEIESHYESYMKR